MPEQHRRGVVGLPVERFDGDGGAGPVVVAGATPASTASRTRACTQRRRPGSCGDRTTSRPLRRRWTSDGERGAGDRAHRRGAELVAEHGSRLGVLPSLGADPSEGGVDDATHADRHARHHVGRHVETVGQVAAAPDEVLQHGQHVERVAGGPGDDRVEHIVARAVTGPRRDEVDDAGTVEHRHLDDLEPVDELGAARRRGLQPVLAGGGEHEEIGDLGGDDVLEDRHGRSVGPVEVVEHDDEAPAGCGLAERIDGGAREHRSIEQHGGRAGEVGRRPRDVELPEELGERTETAEVIGFDPGVDDRRALLVGDAGHLRGEAGLAHAGRPDQHAARARTGAPPTDDLAQHLVTAGEREVAPERDRQPLSGARDPAAPSCGSPRTDRRTASVSADGSTPSSAVSSSRHWR